VSGDCCLAVVHRENVFQPGLQEKLILIARGMAKLVGAQQMA
jgi:hypothetical protein